MALRLRVVGGGCAGFSYDLYFDEPTEVDRQFEIDGRQVRRRRDEPDVPRRHRDRLRRGPPGRRLQVQQSEREVDLRLRLVVLASRSIVHDGHRGDPRARARRGRGRSVRATSGSTTTAATRARCRSSIRRSARCSCESTEQVAAVLRICLERKVPVTPRGAGTGMCGGALPVARRRRAVDRADAARSTRSIRRDLVAVVEPGVITGQLQEAVEAQGLFYPPDPASLEFCSIGGNAATNAGGPRAFKYGVTREYMLGLEVALMGGEVLRCGRRTAKGVTGYDLVAGFVGTEGTFGVITELRVKLAAEAAGGRDGARRVRRHRRPPAPRSRRCCATALRPRVLEIADRASIDVDPREEPLSLPGERRRDRADRGRRRRRLRWRMQMERIGLRCDELGALDVLAATEPAERRARVGGAPADLVVAQGGVSHQGQRGRLRAARPDRRDARARRARRGRDRHRDRGVRPRRRRQPAREPAVATTIRPIPRCARRCGTRAKQIFAHTIAARRHAVGRARHRPDEARLRARWSRASS